jgi:phosphohistidine swiveling domain-containing protein
MNQLINNKIKIGEILKSLPNETAQYVVRDISLLTSSVFGQTHLTVLKKLTGINFKITFWFVRNDGQVAWYRSGNEYNLLIERTGKKALRDQEFVKKSTNTLIRYSDQINSFIRKNKKLPALAANWKSFFELYRDFFAYHQIVYWSSEHLTKLNKAKAAKIVKILNHAYKYNEQVIPNVEKYFMKLGIGHLVYDEISSAIVKKRIKVPKNRSILFFKNDIFILPYKKAAEIDRAIRDNYQKYLNKFRQIKGLAVSGTGVVVKGKARVITDLSKLKNARPGDILITTQTRPQYNAAIRRTRAIVTDEGGLLCHASMLAREFGIPCVVGTKIATQVLKDGDLVEVDAQKGIVKKII